jgi:hypothetical protein
MTKQEQELEKINKLKKEGANLAKPIIEKMNRINSEEITGKPGTYGVHQVKRVALKAGSLRTW